MTSSLRDQTAIVGVGLTPQGKVPGCTNLSLQVDAFKRALDDAGLRKEEIDGLLTEPALTEMGWSLDYLRLGQALGINPAFTASVMQGGATAGCLVQMAAMAVTSGMANYVACVFGDAARTGVARGSRSTERAIGGDDSWGIWGAFGPVTWSAVSASRHMALYGTTSTQLGEVAVAARRHAALHPLAVMRAPITVADHQASR